MGDPPNTSLISIISSSISISFTFHQSCEHQQHQHFLLSRHRWHVPRIGIIHGRLFIVHDSAICDGMAWYFFRQTVNKRKQRFILLKTLHLELRHNGTVIHSNIKSCFSSITFRKQPVCKWREGHKAMSSSSRRGNIFSYLASHHRIVVLHSNNGTNCMSAT